MSTNNVSMEGFSVSETLPDRLPRDKFLLSVFAVCIGAAVIAVPALVSGTRFVVSNLPGLTPILFLLGALVTVGLSWIKYPSEAPYLRITLAGCGLVVGLNTLWLGFDFPVVHEAIHQGVSPLFPVAALIAFVAGVLSLYRPAFAIISAIVFVIQKQLVIAMAGGLPGFSHYLVIVDTIVFVAAAIVAMSLAQIVVRKFLKPDQSATLNTRSNLELYYLIVMCIAIGVHFGNYFLSGFGKAMLDGGLISWILENKTQYTMLAGYNLGSAPLAFSESLFGFSYMAFDKVFILLNLAVLFSQLFCFMAFYRKKFMLMWVVFFDIMHVTIFVLTGALFIHWIILNSLLVISVTKMPKNLAPKPALLIGVFATVLGHFFFNTMQMAWYDNKQVRDTGFVAVYADGSEARVPPNFYRESAYGFYNRWFRLDRDTGGMVDSPIGGMQSTEWPAQTAAWGQVAKIDDMRRGESCEAPPIPEQANQIDFDYQAVEAYIRARHAWALEKIKNGKSLRYNFYPHDHFTMPWRFKKFRQADVKDIVSYYYRVETVCLDWQDGALERQVITRAATEPFVVARDDDGSNGT